MNVLDNVFLTIFIIELCLKLFHGFFLFWKSGSHHAPRLQPDSVCAGLRAHFPLGADARVHGCANDAWLVVYAPPSLKSGGTSSTSSSSL
jgi:hypothetical protein